MIEDGNGNRVALAKGSSGDDDDLHSEGSSPLAGNGTRERILEIMVAHQKWRRDLPGGKRGRMNHCDLSEWTLEGVDFGYADLRGTALVGAKLRRANLSHADLFVANLEGADLREANLRCANLAGARLHHCDLRDALLEGAVLNIGRVTLETRKLGSATGGLLLGVRATALHNANMLRAKLMKADMSGCDLTGANLTGADLRGVNMKGSILIDATLDDVDLDGANLDGAYTFGVQANGAASELLQSAGTADARPIGDLQQRLRMHAEWVESSGEAGEQLDLDGVDLSKAALGSAILKQARLRRCRLIKANLIEADLELADLSWSDLTNAKLMRANLSGTTLRSCTMTDADLTGVKLLPVEFGTGDSKSWPTNLEKSSAYGACFVDAEIRQAVLHDVKVTPATLKDLRDSGVPPMVLRKLIVEAI